MNPNLILKIIANNTKIVINFFIVNPRMAVIKIAKGFQFYFVQLPTSRFDGLPGIHTNVLLYPVKPEF